MRIIIGLCIVLAVGLAGEFVVGYVPQETAVSVVEGDEGSPSFPTTLVVGLVFSLALPIPFIVIFLRQANRRDRYYGRKPWNRKRKR